MWLRDSSVQLAIYLPRIAAHPALRGVFEGMLRSQAFYILQVQFMKHTTVVVAPSTSDAVHPEYSVLAVKG
jgi:meiotically up-regulated gene 157 (Mug157) protein